MKDGWEKLKEELNTKTRKLDKLSEEMTTLSADIRKTKNRMDGISHKYRVGDYVVLKGSKKEVGVVRRLLNRKDYRVFFRWPDPSRRVGVDKDIHEDDILCHVMELDLSGVDANKIV